MADRSIGLIETFGLAACIAAADAAVKSANVKLLGYEYAKGDGMCTVKVEGNVGACKAAIAAGKRAAEMVNGSLNGTKGVLLKARPADGMKELLIENRETVGGEIALAEGYRPAGDSKKPVLVKNWKPKEEPKAETPAEVTPEPPVEESLGEETSGAEKKPDLEEKEEESESEPEAQPEPPSESEPEAEATAEMPKEEESDLAGNAGEEPGTDAPKRKTSTGNNRRRNRKKKPTPEN
ncbi:MAG: BMC domain-containing protein [Eubacteriales bacterium]|nr:BMC domain-containing protein [Eubacteriales bacterium]